LRSAALGLAVASVGLLDSGDATAHVEELTMDTAIQADDLAKYAKRFNNDRPDIQIERVCNPSAIIAEKLLAEKYHPQGDAIWGWRRLPVTGPHDRLRNRPVRSLDPGSGGLVGTENGVQDCGAMQPGGSFQISPTCLTRWNAKQSPSAERRHRGQQRRCPMYAQCTRLASS
jgi:hypothetical protein